MRLSFQERAVSRDVLRVRLLDRDTGIGRNAIRDQGEGSPVARSEVEDLARAWHCFLDEAAKLGDEQIALVRAHHRHPPQGVRFQQPGECIAILTVRVQPLELVAHQLKRLLELSRQLACCLFVDPNGHRYSLVSAAPGVKAAIRG